MGCASIDLFVVMLLCIFRLALIGGHHLNEKDDSIREELRNRVFSGSTTAPLRTAIASNETAVGIINKMTDHFERIEERLSQRLRDEKRYGLSPDDEVCNRHQDFAQDAFRTKLKTLGLPPAASLCVTELNLNNSSMIWESKLAFIDVTRAAGASLLENPNINTSTWDKAYEHGSFSYLDSIDKCDVLHSVGFRWRRRWAVMVSVTQYPVTFPKKDFGREYFVEYLLSTGGGKIDSLKMTLPRYPDGNVSVPNSTTTREIWRGTPASSIFRNVLPVNENPAVLAALRSKQGVREQVFDMRTPSNISIMVLSCMLSLVPLSVFGDFRLVPALLYILLTDIASCTPLAIKGVELINQTSIHHADVAWVYGVTRPVDSTMVIESWTARCMATHSVRIVGTVLLLISLTFMLIGIGLEVWTFKRMRQRLLIINISQMYQANRSLIVEAASEQPCYRCGH